VPAHAGGAASGRSRRGRSAAALNPRPAIALTRHSCTRPVLTSTSGSPRTNRWPRSQTRKLRFGERLLANPWEASRRPVPGNLRLGPMCVSVTSLHTNGFPGPLSHPRNKSRSNTPQQWLERHISQCLTAGGIRRQPPCMPSSQRPRQPAFGLLFQFHSRAVPSGGSTGRIVRHHADPVIGVSGSTIGTGTPISPCKQNRASHRSRGVCPRASTVGTATAAAEDRLPRRSALSHGSRMTVSPLNEHFSKREPLPQCITSQYSFSLSDCIGRSPWPHHLVSVDQRLHWSRPSIEIYDVRVEDGTGDG
jgi:hypothetical protein